MEIRRSYDHLISTIGFPILVITSIGNPIMEIRRSYDRLISTIGFPILVRRHFYIESTPGLKRRVIWDSPVLACLHAAAFEL